MGIWFQEQYKQGHKYTINSHFKYILPETWELPITSDSSTYCYTVRMLWNWFKVWISQWMRKFGHRHVYVKKNVKQNRYSHILIFQIFVIGFIYIFIMQITKQYMLLCYSLNGFKFLKKLWMKRIWKGNILHIFWSCDLPRPLIMTR